LIVIVALLMSGCQTAPPVQRSGPPSGAAQAASPQHPQTVKEWLVQQKRAKRGALVGALLGAVVGAAAAGAQGKDPLAGAVAGGVVGALAGFLVGKSQDRLHAHRDQAVQTASYDPSQGYVARVEEVRFEPAQPKPGQTTKLVVRYLVVGPDPREDITVQLYRGLKYQDEYVMGAGPNQFVVPRGGGIVESTVAVTLPDKAPQGTYLVEALLEDPSGRFAQVKGLSSLYIVA
jgi:hypothetical protein